MSANDKTGVGSGRDDWRTPPDLFVQLDRLFKFNYDAFASAENALCGRYSSLAGTFDYVGDKLVQITGDDGLVEPWGWKSRVFMNPPYSRGFITDAVSKAAREHNRAGIIVALLPDARDTAWWRTWVRPFATDYPIGRVHFIHPDGDCGSRVCAQRHEPGKPCRDAPGGSVVAVYLPDWLRGGAGRTGSIL